MFKLFYPSCYVKSVFTIDYEKLYQMGYRGLVFDIDNTLVHHGDDSTPEIDSLFREIHNIGFKTLLFSNNNAKRIERFNKNIGTLYIDEADKPKTDNYFKASEMLNLPKEQVIFIGDQLFTDILGANRAGFKSILVEFIRLDSEKKIGKRREAEKIILSFYLRNKKMKNRLGSIQKEGNNNMATKKLFCEINPTCYKISTYKEILLRHLKNLKNKPNYATKKDSYTLPVILFEHHSDMIKRGPGIDPVLQENKADNIRLASSKMNGLIIHPGEVFSFWKYVGKTSKRNGFKEGRVLVNNKLQPGLGGGLCNLANTIHLLVLHSPLTVTEFHSHSDCLAPDHGKRIPFSAGTSVNYNYIDYRFRNDTEQNIQLMVWCDGDYLHAELRGEKELPVYYDLLEEEHCFRKEGENYYRHSKIYKLTLDKQTNEQIDKKLVLKNHSKVMYDPRLIPKELITT